MRKRHKSSAVVVEFIGQRLFVVGYLECVCVWVLVDVQPGMLLLLSLGEENYEKLRCSTMLDNVCFYETPLQMT